MRKASVCTCGHPSQCTPHKVKHSHPRQTLSDSLAIVCLPERWKRKKKKKKNVETSYTAAFKSNLDESVEAFCNKRWLGVAERRHFVWACTCSHWRTPTRVIHMFHLLNQTWVKFVAAEAVQALRCTTTRFTRFVSIFSHPNIMNVNKLFIRRVFLLLSSNQLCSYCFPLQLTWLNVLCECKNRESFWAEFHFSL